MKQAEIGPTNLTTVLFDDKYEILHNGIDAKKAVLTEKEYYTRGSTALLDAVGKTINDVGKRLGETPEAKRPGKVIFVITTDGLENASVEFSYDDVKRMITRQSEKYGWEFIFMGANIDAAQEGNKIGILKDRAFGFTSDTKGLSIMYSKTDSVCKNLRKSG
jgi:hypothetical protein